jgi:hypothetical protein
MELIRILQKDNLVFRRFCDKIPKIKRSLLLPCFLLLFTDNQFIACYWANSSRIVVALMSH